LKDALYMDRGLVNGHLSCLKTPDFARRHRPENHEGSRLPNTLDAKWGRALRILEMQEVL